MFHFRMSTSTNMRKTYWLEDDVDGVWQGGDRVKSCEIEGTELN